MIKKRVIAAVLILVLVLVFWILTPIINSSNQISESGKNIFGYITEVCIALGIIGFVLTLFMKE
jgi:hypothetical protein